VAVTYPTGVRNVRDYIEISIDADPVDVTLYVQDAHRRLRRPRRPVRHRLTRRDSALPSQLEVMRSG
jgi:hypothetical protein